MTELDFLNACVLGLVQGLTEFQPVSSSGHLVLTQKALSLESHSPTLLLFDITTHVATLIAVAVVFRASIFQYTQRLIRELSPSFTGKRTACTVATLAAVACIPTAAIGFTFRGAFERAFDSMPANAIGLLVTGSFLHCIGRLPRPRRGWRRFGWWRAVAIGVAQGCAILPGVSRSGSTICTGILLGIKRRWAAEFSFLIAVPPIVGAGLIQWRETLELPAEQLDRIPWGPIIVGSVVAFLSGAYALRILLRLVVRDKLHHFSYYCWTLGLAVLAITLLG